MRDCNQDAAYTVHVTATIKEQLDLEAAMVGRGIERYENAVKSATKQKRGADTKHARRLMQAHIETMTAAISAYCEEKRVGVRNKYRTLLKRVEPDKAAYFLLRGVFNALMLDPTLQSVAISIGGMVEDEVRFAKFKKENREYYDEIVKDFHKKGTKSYRHVHRVLTFKANEMQDNWKSWTTDERAGVGLKLIDLLLNNTELVEIGSKPIKHKGKSPLKILRATPATVEWVQKYTDYASMLDPDRTPTIIEPDPWTSIDQGGYYSPQLRSITPFILGASKEHSRLLRSADMHRVFAAVNVMQSVPWRVNGNLLTVVQEVWSRNLRIGMPPSEPYTIPPAPIKEGQKSSTLTGTSKEAFDDWKRDAAILYSMEGERVSKCFQISRTLRMAREYSAYSKIWFVYQCDFRGRVYAASSGLSPQGADLSKALLQFAEGKQLGSDGLFWLRVHGANVFGFDKAIYSDRAAWTVDREELITAIANDPISNASHWRVADKPWQFLAFCIEYARAIACADPRRFVSHLPVALDGSCNGLQHFSAMLRDPVGGAATNLCRADVPADIYSEVAGVCTGRLNTSDDAMAGEWVAFCNRHGEGSIPRGLAKKPVMTLPYGSTKRTCTDSIFQFVRETEKGFFSCGDFRAALWLTEHLWASISEVVVSARTAMDFIQDVASRLGHLNKALTWETQDGFLVYQARKKMKQTRVSNMSLGSVLRYSMMLRVPTKQMDPRKQSQGSAPNFVHSQDGTHLRMTLLEGQKAGISAWAMIHDDFGTHACDVPTLHRCIRSTFVDLYKTVGTLDRWYDSVCGDVALDMHVPPNGDLDIRAVKEAPFFFG